MDRRILKNVGLNLMGTIVPIGISLLTVPLYLSTLGAARYGAINLVWTLIGYFGVLDLGISLATENRISMAKAAAIAAGQSPQDGVAEIFFSALCVNALTGLVGGTLVWVGTATYLAHFGHLSPEFSREVLASLPWLAVAVPLANITWVMAGALTGVERFAVYNANQVLGMAMFQCLPLAAAMLISPSLPVVVATAVIARVLAAILLGVATWRTLELRGWRRPNPKLIRELFSFGTWVVIGGSADMFSASLDRMMIGALLGARSVAFYATPQNLVNRLSVLPSAVMRTLFPRLSASSRDDAHHLTRQSIALVAALLTPATVVAICLLQPFLVVWVGHELASASVAAGRVFALATWVASTASVVRILMQAQSDPHRAARLSVVQLPLLAALLWFGITHLGLVGAALAMLCKSLIDAAMLIRLSRIGGRMLLTTLWPHAACLGAAFVVVWLASGPLTLLAGTALLVAGNLGLSVAMSAPLRAFLRESWLRSRARRRARAPANQPSAPSVLQQGDSAP